jgi:hypothetical protein
MNVQKGSKRRINDVPAGKNPPHFSTESWPIGSDENGAAAMRINVGFASVIGGALLLAFLAAPVAARSLWDHNGSLMELKTDGAEQSLRYFRPRPSLREAGVAKGSVLFIGKKTGNRFSGSAHLFSKQCGAVAYDVKGSLSENSRRLTLTGRAPKRNAQCQVVGHRDDVLVFTQQAIAEQQPAPAAKTNEAPLEAPRQAQIPQESKNDVASVEDVAELPAATPVPVTKVARLAFPVMGCTSRETFDQWVETFRRADADSEAQVVAQGMRTKSCAALRDGPVEIVQGDDNYLCVRPSGKTDCYWTLRASVQ